MFKTGASPASYKFIPKSIGSLALVHDLAAENRHHYIKLINGVLVVNPGIMV
jgi:hypothetical protein